MTAATDGPHVSGPAFDPWDPAFVADPYPAFAELRARGRVLYYEPSDQWLVPIVGL